MRIDETTGETTAAQAAGVGGADQAAWQRMAKGLLCVAALAVAVGCASRRPSPPAPVVQGQPVRPAPSAPSAPSAPVAANPSLPGAENAGQPGYYTVRPGDTLIRIASEQRQSWRDLAQWNRLANPNVLEVGQVLRVAPPGREVSTATAPVTPVPTPGSDTVGAVPAPPLEARPLEPVAPVSSGGNAASALGSFIWPAQGNVVQRFDGKAQKGISIAGRMGDPVVAVADGTVAIAGAPIRGLGNLVVLQHPNGFITAYAHNQTLLVKENQAVRQGQTIAEMGSSDSDTVRLHFEVRNHGKPVDPLQHLPPR